MNAARNDRTAVPSSARRILWLRAGAVLALGACGAAHAYDERCVTTAAQLEDAIADAVAAPEFDIRHIIVHVGSYQLAGDLELNTNGGADAKDIYVRGGWTDANCNDEDARVEDPNMTVISGIPETAQHFGSDFRFIGDNKTYSFESVRFTNFGAFIVSDEVCPLAHICPDTNDIRFDHVAFDHGGTVLIEANDAESVVFQNNLVHHMKQVYDSGYAIWFDIRNNEDAPQISYNTFADIECASAAGAVLVQSANPSVALHHNIIQSSCPFDLYISGDDGGQPQTPFYNLLGNANALALGNLALNGNVLTGDAKFDDAANGNYRLADDSPAVNAGATLTQSLLHGFAISTADLDGAFRPVGTRWDIGAYESTKNDGVPAVITVNSNDDVDDGTCNATHCSLREAINKANAQDNTPQSIVFDMPGSCPQTILLNAALPGVTDALTIDGYTQPGSFENEKQYGSNANICVLIGEKTNIAHAFSVPVGQPDSTALTVRGIGFGSGFFTITTAAIELRAGSGHYISGNAFGGFLPTTGAGLNGMSRGVFLGGTARNATIGGSSYADRNYFGSMSENAIVVNLGYDTPSGHVIRNNYIGVRPDGLTAQANSADGISSSNGSEVLIDKNTIAASDFGISLLSGTKNDTLTRNNIGVNALGIGNATLSNLMGIVVALGSFGHTIGAAPLENVKAGSYSNFIDNNLGDGILIDDDAGGSNSIRGNAIGANGKGGSGIGIDLGGSLAQLANDFGDADTGPNAKQNYPRISGSAPSGAGTRLARAILNTQPNQTLRIDFYHALSCGGAKGADATRLVGSYDVNSGANGAVKFSWTVAEGGSTGYLTATATTTNGQTSELAPCVAEDTIFTTGGEL
jgi:CSLREA domain-containing protein